MYAITWHMNHPAIALLDDDLRLAYNPARRYAVILEIRMA